VNGLLYACVRWHGMPVGSWLLYLCWWAIVKQPAWQRSGWQLLRRVFWALFELRLSQVEEAVG
jgi:hypothetical protein